MKSLCFFACLLFVFVCMGSNVHGQIITTLAGTGTPGFSGDYGQATDAELNYPGTMAVDRSGNIYIADVNNNRIRMINHYGRIFTIAGIGTAGYSGDGGDATAAEFDRPWGVAVDRHGNLFIVDGNNHCIRKIEASTGTISTVVGIGYYSGFSGDGGPATAARLSYPGALAIDSSNNLYLIDNGNNRIRKVDSSGTITTIAGNGSVGFGGDGGAATAATFNFPYGLALDLSGNVYISDYYNHRIRKVTPSGIINTIAGNGTGGHTGDGGPATAAQFWNPSGVATDNRGNVYFADWGDDCVREVTPSGTIITIAGNRSFGYSGDGGPASRAEINQPIAVVVDGSGNLLIGEGYYPHIRKVDTCWLPYIAPITGSSTICIGASTTLSDTTPGGSWSDAYTFAARITSGGVVTAYYGGLTEIFYTKSNSCGTVASTFWIRVSPNGGSIYGPPAICVGSTNHYGTDGDSGSWSCSPTSIATISAGGILTGVSAGTVTLSFSVSGSCGAAVSTRNIIVDASPHAGTVTGLSGVCVSSAITLADTTGGGTWTSGAISVATISSGGIVTGVAAGTAIVSYSVTNSCGTATATRSLTVNPLPNAGTITGTSHVCISSAITLSNTVSGGTWMSGATSIATVSTGGIVTGVSVGTAIISFSLTNSCGTAVDTMMIAVNPSPAAGTITGPSSVCFGSTITLTDTASGGTWSSSTPSIATISSGGIATGVSVGTANISYTVTNSCGTAMSWHTVTVDPVLHVGSISGASNVCAGSTITLTDTSSGGTWSSSNTSLATVSTTGVVMGIAVGSATISYTIINSCGTSVATHAVTVNALPGHPGTISGPSTVCETSTITLTDTATGGTWSSSSTSLATVSSTGIVRGLAAGRVIISYTKTNSCGSRSAVDTITVNPLPHSGSITGASVVCAGYTISMTDTFSGGSWSSSNTSLATVNTSGVVMGVAAGSVTISYTVTNSCGTSVATHAVTVNPIAAPGTISGPSTVCEASTITLTDTATGGTWSSSSTAMATVSSSGIVRGVAVGRVIISYTKTNSCGSRSAVDTITVNPLPHSGTISGASVVCAASTIALSDTSSGGTWSSSSTAIATVSSSGVVLGVSAGSVTISYTVTNSCGTSIATHAITVNPLAVSGTVSGPSSVCVTTTGTFTVSGASGAGTWSSSSTSVATVSASGMATGVSGGSAIISYTVTNSCGSTSDTVMVTVRPLPVVTAITGTFIACPGVTSALACTTSGGTWSSSSPSVATISASGVVTTVTGGSTIISYTLTNSCGSTSATHAFVVNPLPDAGVITGASSLCTGATITLTDSASGGVWSSTNTAVATVDAAGLVTGIAAGVDTIYYTVTFSCGATRAIHVITVNPLPDAGTISGTNIVCPAATVTLTCTSSTGAWSSSDNTIATVGSTGIVTGVSSGSCNISYTATNTCGSAGAVFPVTVLPISFCPDEVKITTTTTDHLSIYPNPAEADFTVLLSSSFSEVVTVHITNVTGQLVQQFTATTNKTIPVTMQQPSGVYFVSALTSHGRYVGSVVLSGLK